MSVESFMVACTIMDLERGQPPFPTFDECQLKDPLRPVSASIHSTAT